jgi:predicted PolB exonuclease-like 3'-5' exonuclease
MKRIVVDIETVPLAASMLTRYPEDRRNPPANYKSDEAIAKWRANDRIEWQDGLAKECSLNPRLGRVLCIGMKLDDEPTVVHMAKSEEDEDEVLRAFWKTVELSEGEVITWNGAWDLRFIVIRSVIRGIPFTEHVAGYTTRLWFRKYTYAPHTDCKAVLTNWDQPRSGEGLNEWCAAFGLPAKTDGITGADVYQMYLDGKWDQLAEYNKGDVDATYGIYKAAVQYMIAP